MGLDISAYKLGEPIDPKSPDFDENDDGYVHVWQHPHFSDRLGGTKEGYYKNLGERYVWGKPYSYYNRWRNLLAKMAGYPKTKYKQDGMTLEGYDAGAWDKESGPFWELINFADNEGCFASAIAAKLAKDFEEFDAKAKVFGNNQPRGGAGADFYKDYQLIREAFDFAKDGGLVLFH